MIHQRVAAALVPSPGARRKITAITPDFSAASDNRREAVMLISPTSPSTAPKPG